MIKLLIDADGTLSNYEVVRGVSKNIDKEALRVVKTMKNFEAATYNGKKVRSIKIVYIIFNPK